MRTDVAVPTEPAGPNHQLSQSLTRAAAFCRRIDLLTIYDRGLAVLTVADSLGQEARIGYTALRARLLLAHSPDAVDQSLDWLKDNRPMLGTLLRQLRVKVRELSADFEAETIHSESRPVNRGEHAGLLGILGDYVTDLGAEGRALYEVEPRHLTALGADIELFLSAAAIPA